MCVCAFRCFALLHRVLFTQFIDLATSRITNPSANESKTENKTQKFDAQISDFRKKKSFESREANDDDSKMGEEEEEQKRKKKFLLLSDYVRATFIDLLIVVAVQKKKIAHCAVF